MERIDRQSGKRSSISFRFYYIFSLRTSMIKRFRLRTDYLFLSPPIFLAVVISHYTICNPKPSLLDMVQSSLDIVSGSRFRPFYMHFQGPQSTRPRFSANFKIFPKIRIFVLKNYVEKKERPKSTSTT